MTRAEILSHALFDTGGEIDGVKFGPISQPCLVLLKRRGNTFFTDAPRDQDEHEAIGEILFAISRTKEQRTALIRDSAEEWDMKVAEFIVGLEDSTLPRFRDEYLAPALNALAMAMVESERPGKPVPSPATSPSSSAARSGSGSTNSRQPSARKTRIGASPPAPSCSSSTSKPSATGPASAGSTGRKQTRKKSPSSSGSRRKK